MAQSNISAVNWFAERTSMHGVPSLVNSRSKKSKMFWATVCLVGMGMFLFMLVSLILKYFSYPTAVKIEEVAKGIVLPKVSFCNKRFASMMAEVAYAKFTKVENNNSNSVFSGLKNSHFANAIRDYSNLLLSLDKLDKALHEETETNGNETFINDTENAILKQWSDVKNELSTRRLLFTLLTNKHVDGKPTARLSELKRYFNDSVVHCSRRAQLRCNESYTSGFLSINSVQCHTYDMAEGKSLQENSAQGIENGITLVFMTGSRIIASQYDKSLWSVPGFRNLHHNSVGSDGVRLVIHSPDLSPMPNIDGIDIAPGMDTMIGITSREDIRLPHPYGDCSNHNIEGELLMKSIETKLGYKLNAGASIQATVYNVAKCRGTCLLRHIWENCGCLLMSENLPFLNASLLCGHINNQMLFNPAKYDVEVCFQRRNLLSERCKSIFQKLFTDLMCLRKVLDIEDEKNTGCNCPVPCHSRDYDLTIGNSEWPSAGPELDAAYRSIVVDKVIPYFKSFNSSIGAGVITYLSEKENKMEIMKNFATLTLYVKNLRVERVVQTADYSLLDLVSDIGGQLGLWVGVSAITVCEIFGFISLAIQNAFKSENRTKKTTSGDRSYF